MKMFIGNGLKRATYCVKWFKDLLHKTAVHARMAMSNASGDGFVDTAIKMLQVVVIGALILAALYILFGDVVMPMITQRITEMFNYKG